MRCELEVVMCADDVEMMSLSVAVLCRPSIWPSGDKHQRQQQVLSGLGDPQTCPLEPVHDSEKILALYLDSLPTETSQMIFKLSLSNHLNQTLYLTLTLTKLYI